MRYEIRPDGHTAWGEADTRHQAARLAAEASARGLRRVVVYDTEARRVIGRIERDGRTHVVWDDEQEVPHV